MSANRDRRDQQQARDRARYKARRGPTGRTPHAADPDDGQVEIIPGRVFAAPGMVAGVLGIIATCTPRLMRLVPAAVLAEYGPPLCPCCGDPLHPPIDPTVN